MKQTISNIGMETGTQNTTYNLISLVYHALQGAETYLMYEQDAEQAGETEIAEFFREAISGNRDLADRAKQYLTKRWCV